MSTFNLSRALRWNVHRRPEKEALVDADQRLSYAELDRRVDAVAAGFAELGFGDGDIAAILADNSADYIVQMLAVNRLGGAYVPLNWRLHPDELAHIVNHSTATLLITEARWHDAAKQTLAQVSGVEHVVTRAEEAPDGWVRFAQLERSGEGRGPVADAEKGHDDLQRILYTSGTTSHPKGVMITHGNVIWNMLGQILELELSADDRLGLTAPLFHVSGQDVPGWTALYLGATWVVSPSYRGEDIARLIREEQLTGMILAAQIINDMMAVEGLDGSELTSLRWLVFGGFAPAQYQRLQQFLPHVRLVEAFGMTELTNGAAYLDGAHARTKVGSQGPPFPHVDFRVVDDDGEELPPGQEGELTVRGPKVTAGYWRDPEATAAVYRDGWFHTGDYVELDDDGYLWFVDRKKDMIKSGGENVASAEIERVLYTHASVAAAAVVGVPDERWDEVPKALVILRDGAEATGEELREHCLERLAKFKVPKLFEIVEELPRNDSGKILKRELRERERERYRPGA